MQRISSFGEEPILMSNSFVHGLVFIVSLRAMNLRPVLDKGTLSNFLGTNLD